MVVIYKTTHKKVTPSYAFLPQFVPFLSGGKNTRATLPRCTPRGCLQCFSFLPYVAIRHIMHVILVGYMINTMIINAE